MGGATAVNDRKPVAERLESSLLAARLASTEELERARQDVAVTGRPLMRVLVEQGVMTERDKLKFLKSFCNLEVISLRDIAPRPEVAGLVSTEKCRRHRMVPIRMEAGNRVLVAMEDPTDLSGRTLLETAIERDLVVVIASGEDIDLAIGRMPYLGGDSVPAPVSSVQNGMRVATVLLLTFLPLIAGFYLVYVTQDISAPDFVKELDTFGRSLLFLLAFLSWASLAYFITDVIFGKRQES